MHSLPTRSRYRQSQIKQSCRRGKLSRWYSKSVTTYDACFSLTSSTMYRRTAPLACSRSPSSGSRQYFADLSQTPVRLLALCTSPSSSTFLTQRQWIVWIKSDWWEWRGITLCQDIPYWSSVSLESDISACHDDTSQSARMGLILPSEVHEPEDVDLYHQVQDRFERIKLASKQYFCLIDDDIKAGD